MINTTPMNGKQSLAIKLLDIQHLDEKATKTRSTLDKDAFYEHRAIAIHEAIALALQVGYVAGIRIDPDQPEWPVALIELPTGQVSWHLKGHLQKWDGHSNETKQARMLRFSADALRGD